MPQDYKLRPPVVSGVKFTNALAQASDVAGMVKATAFSVDTTQKSATFTVPDLNAPVLDVEAEPVVATYTVSEGQAITYASGLVTVMTIDEFVLLYEPIE